MVDNIYSTIIRLIASGRFAAYTNSRLPFGDLGTFGTRYSEVLFGANLNWIAKLSGEVSVKAPAPIWWEDMVYWNKTAEGKRQLIVPPAQPPGDPRGRGEPHVQAQPARQGHHGDLRPGGRPEADRGRTC